MTDESDTPREGIHVISTFYKCKCPLNKLIIPSLAANEIEQSITNAQLNIVGSSQFISFNKTEHDQYGYTALIALSESHVALHTYPELNKISIQISICHYTRDNTDKARNLFESLLNVFNPDKYIMQEIQE